MKYKTSGLEELDEAVALALGWKPSGGYWWEPGTIESDGGLALPDGRGSKCMRRVEMYCRDWAHGSPIIEEERIAIVCSRPRFDTNDGALWDAYFDARYTGPDGQVECDGEITEGPTPLIAAMRAFVAAKLGDEVDL